MENLLVPPQIVHTIPRCSNLYVTTAPVNLYPSTSVPMNLNKSYLHSHHYQQSMCQLSDTPSNSSLSLKASVSDIASSASSLEAHSVSISRSTSLDSFKDKHQTKHHTSSLRKCVSLNNLNRYEEEDENYVLPSILPLNASCSNLSTSCSSYYLTILPNKISCYEELKDPDDHYEKVCFEPEYSTISDSMTYSLTLPEVKNV